MNISYNWLTKLAPTITESPVEIASQLGLLGAPVDELVEMSEGLDDIVVARVEAVNPHPNADRLRLCSVNAGGEILQVVCGAPNVEAGNCYPFAPVGATMPGGMEIRKAKLRGESSEGMLCSARELGLGRDHAGLMVLNGEWDLGAGLVNQLGLRDSRLVLDLTPNRPDLLSHLGVAREVAPGGVADVVLPPFAEGSDVHYDTVEGDAEVVAGGLTVRIEDASDCPRYMAVVVEGVEIGPSPQWLATRLRTIGVRPINNVVDATNYVLHEVGQPLHAFDLDLLGNAVGVRRARDGEGVRTLDSADRALEAGALVITDGSRPVALAGIMGGEDTEVGPNTKRILIECALFDPIKVRKTARQLGLSTDASHRFERGVDREGQPRALRRVVELILATAGGTVAGPALDAHPGKVAALQIDLRLDRVGKLLGVDLPTSEIQSLLAPIGFESEANGDILRVAVPTYRPDVTREVDLIEEIARRRGYDSFDGDVGVFRPGVVPEDPQIALQADVHRFFGRWGFLEARTAAFAPAMDSRVPLLNPLSLEESHLRDDLTSGLLSRVEHNWSHGVRAIRLYEIGTVFSPSGGDRPAEDIHLSAVVTGASQPAHWSGEGRSFDLWDLKGLAAELGQQLGFDVGSAVDGEWKDGTRSIAATEGFALIGAEGEQIGVAGRVDSERLDSPPWSAPVFVLEVSLRPAPKTEMKVTPLPAFPGVERDLALIIPEGTTARGVEEVIAANGGENLQTFAPFDLYRGEGIPAGTHSIAWRLHFRRADRTLTDDEVDRAIQKVVEALDDKLGVRRR